MRNIFRLCVIMACWGCLSSCASLNRLLNDTSTKHVEKSSANNQAALVAKPAEPKCEKWCHNGWCSTHCEGAPDQNQL